MKRLKSLDDWIVSGVQNKWIITPYWSLYVRRGKHRLVLEEGIVRTLDIGSVCVNEKYWRRGIFKRLLKRVEQVAAELHLPVYVECISNDHLYAYLLRQGYQQAYHVMTPDGVGLADRCLFKRT